MDYVAKMFLYFISFFFNVLSVALLIRAVLSWFIDEDSKIMVFFVYITEPAVGLVRGTIGRIFEKYASPIDFSYLITVVIVELINLIVNSML